MEPYLVWWILAALLVGLELTSGTFYLLVYGVAAAVAGFAAWLGGGFVLQLLVAGIIALLGTLALRNWKRNAATEVATPQDLDIGKPVEVEAWHQSSGQVRYRGALWDAEAESQTVDLERPLVIKAVRGNTLLVGNRV